MNIFFKTLGFTYLNPHVYSDTVFFLGNFLLGITNAGVRILRTTYIFNHVPNNLIGRTGSVFNTLNIVMRMLLIGLFTFSFFQNSV